MQKTLTSCTVKCDLLTDLAFQLLYLSGVNSHNCIVGNYSGVPLNSSGENSNIPVTWFSCLDVT